jgi:hypothetical protein
MTHKITVFQTRRHYSAKGQRIAYTSDDNNIYFVDVDRGIDGVLPNQYHLTHVPSWELLMLYDAGGYRYYEHNELPIREELRDRALHF